MTEHITSTVTVLRAVGVEFVRRKLRPLIIIAAVAVLLIHALGIWLTTQSVWWWLLEAIFIGGTIILAAAGIAMWLILKRVSPSLNRNQRRSVARFVDKLERMAEHLQTPQPVIIYNVIRDTVRPRKESFIEGVIHDSTSLGGDFATLRHDLQ
jgi:hypothetical protein